MAEAIGISTNIKDAMNMIDDGVPPVLTYHGFLYVLETEGRDLGALYYTKFINSTTPEYSVHIPYSFAHTVGYLLDKGDNLRAHLPPRMDTLPAIVYATFYRNPKATDMLNDNLRPPTTITKRGN